MVDNTNGIQVFSYDGRVLSNPRFPGLRVQFLNKKTLSLSSDTVAVVGRSESKASSGADSKGVCCAWCGVGAACTHQAAGSVVRVLDAHTGRAVSTINHNLDVLEIALSHFSGDMNERRLAFIDQNRDLYITPVLKELPVRCTCVAAQRVSTAHNAVLRWHRSSFKPWLTASPGTTRQTCWLLLRTASCSRGSTPQLCLWTRTSLSAFPTLRCGLCPDCSRGLGMSRGIREEKDGAEFGKLAQFSTFFGSRVTVRRADGALVTSSVNLYPPVLYVLPPRQVVVSAICAHLGGVPGTSLSVAVAGRKLCACAAS